MPRNNYQTQDIPVEKLTHVIFSFTEVIRNRMVFPDKPMGDKLKKLGDQKESNPGLKVMVACGY